MPEDAAAALWDTRPVSAVASTSLRLDDIELDLFIKDRVRYFKDVQ